MFRNSRNGLSGIRTCGVVKLLDGDTVIREKIFTERRYRKQIMAKWLSEIKHLKGNYAFHIALFSKTAFRLSKSQDYDKHSLPSKGSRSKNNTTEKTEDSFSIYE